MARIEGVDIPSQKRVVIALTYIYGIGNASAKRIIEKVEIDPATRVFQLNEDQIAKLRKIIDEEYQVEGDLRSKIAIDIKRLMDVNSYRGQRHRKGLPVRGQRTKTNARTRKGRKQTVANKKK